MARKLLSLRLLLEELELIPSTFVGDELKGLMRWQVGKGQARGFALGFYLRRIILAHREADAQQREATARLRGKSSPHSIREIVDEAERAQG